MLGTFKLPDWPGFHWVALLTSVIFDTCFHLIIFTVAGGCLPAESARALGKATSKLSTRKNRRRPLPGLAWSELVNEGCSCAPHAWRQSKIVPSKSMICPK